MIGIHKIGRVLPENQRMNSKVGADTMAYEIIELFKRRDIKFKICNNLKDIDSSLNTLLVISGVLEKSEFPTYVEAFKKVGRVLYLIDDPKLIRKGLLQHSELIIEPCGDLNKYKNQVFFPPELWTASYMPSMVSPENERPFRLIYWGSDTGADKAMRLEKYFPKHTTTYADDILYLKSKRYGFDSRVDIDKLEYARSKSKYTVCVCDSVLTKRKYYNGRIYEALVSGILPLIDSKYQVYGFRNLLTVKNKFGANLIMSWINNDDKLRIDKVLDLQDQYRKSLPTAEDDFLKVVL